MKSCLCVIGWYFPQSFFEILTEVPEIDFYLISHRPKDQIPKAIQKIVPSNRLILAENIGYDWGGYQQFLHLGIFKKYDFCFFSHDDIEIKELSIFEYCADELSIHPNKGKIMGNGRQTHKRDWPKTHIQSYAHSRWKPPSWDFLHDTVRGSFWATSCEVLQLISPLEVFWDRKKLLGVGSGNWSLRATCGKAQAILGEKAFTFISETYMTSKYLDELVRGKPDLKINPSPFSWRIRNKAVVTYARALMKSYMNSRSMKWQALLKSTMSFSFDHL